MLSAKSTTSGVKSETSVSMNDLLIDMTGIFRSSSSKPCICDSVSQDAAQSNQKTVSDEAKWLCDCFNFMHIPEAKTEAFLITLLHEEVYIQRPHKIPNTLTMRGDALDVP